MGKVQFPADVVSDIIKSVIREVFEQAKDVYPEIFAEKWAALIEEKVLWNLSKLNNPFNYIVCCAIMQKNGAGLHCISSCYWDDSTDGSCTIRWENFYLNCIVTVYGMSI
ncbi:hypothetical protein JTE90_016980 [Oedothorax gibbosus]|uniref:Dynein light chain Tctex-type 1 n=1 Tax=Oedothorax gibbosus TaxID=931172 RepID=A0AAV6TQG4_9ARAC|nr:hypothetical protein JTE90_016980 [Oedothorax gibbosus]